MAEAQGSSETIKVFDVVIRFTDEGVQRVVKMTTNSIDKAKAAVASYDNTLEGFQATIKETSRAVGMGKGSGSNPSGLAAALTQELGRGISDAQYGMIGMSNNMSQFATLAGALTEKTGGMKKAFQAFTTSLMGPNGVIVGINLLITLLPQLTKLLNKTEEAAKKLEETLGKTADAEVASMEGLIDLAKSRIELAQAQGVHESVIKKLMEDKNKLIDSMITKRQQLNKEDKVNLQNLEDERVALQNQEDEYLRRMDGRLGTFEEKFDSATQSMRKFEVKRSEEAQQRLNRLAEIALEQAELSVKTYKEEARINDLRAESSEKVGKTQEKTHKDRVAQVKHAEVLARKEGGAHQSVGRIIIEGNEQQREALLDGTKNQAKAVEERIRLMKVLLAAIAKFNKEVAAMDAGEAARQQAEFDRKRQAIEQFLEGIIALGQGLNDLVSAQSEVANARADLEIERERELMNAKMASARTTQEKAKIEENYEKKVRAINEKRIKDELKAELMSLKIKAATTLAEMAISQSGALVDLFKGEQKTKASSPYPANIPLVAGYLLSAFATFKQMKAARMKAAAEIKSLAPGAGGPSGGGTGASFSPNFNIVGNTGANQLKDAIDNSLGEQNKEPVKAYVVLDELNAANDMKRQSESSSTL